MNHVYRLLWSDVTLSFVVVAEHARSRRKRSGCGKAAVLLAGAMLASSAMAQQAPLPGGAQVSAGQASVSTVGSTMTVNQGTAKAAINWNSFSIGKGATVNFVQPSSSAVVLNRVVGNEASVIDGTLNANGQVFLLNSNGVLFNQSASVNTAGLVATTMALSDADFNASRYAFSNNGSTASVINFGNFNIAEGGYAALLGRQVSNQGTITARLGTVALAAGDQVSLNFSGNSLLNVTVDKAVLAALVENRSAILADGGQVILTARAVDALMATVVNNTGEIRARTVANRAGKIYLLGGSDGGTVNVAGTLDASAAAGDGGYIDTSGAHVQVADGAVVSTLAAAGATGNWLIDPNDYTIAASGGNITGAQLATSLNSSNVTIATATQGSSGGHGDIVVNDAITKTGAGATTLTLLAERNITFNQAVSSTTGRLNVVATADADNNATGNVLFNAGGSVTTHGGNFYAGALDDGRSPTTRGQNFTMQDGSFINVGAGTLAIYMADTVTLAGASLLATSAPYYGSYYNDGNYNLNAYYTNNLIVSAANAIVNGAADPASANIIGTAGASLSAGDIGTSTAPLTLSAPSGTDVTQFYGYHGLNIQNGSGSTYVNAIGPQAFSDVSIVVGSQANSTQRILLTGDATYGTGHIQMTTDANGVLNLASGAIDTGGVPGTDYVPIIRPTNVTLSAQHIVFADNAVNTGTTASYFTAAFSANGTLTSAAAANGVAEINGRTVSLNGSVGAAINPLEVNAIDTLSLSNTASAYVSALGDGPSTVNLNTASAAGTQAVTFTNGDQINISADGTKQTVGSIGAGSGIDLHNGNRALNWTPGDGYVVLDSGAIDLGGGSLRLALYNTAGPDGAALTALHARDGVAEITAGDVAFNLGSGADNGISNIEIAHGGTSTSNSLNIYNEGASGGGIDLTELSPGHFKSLSLTLNSNAAQNVHIGLYGADDLDLALGTDAVTLNATNVNLSAYNRNFQLYTNKSVQIDGVALSTGYYVVNASGRTLTLNSDVLTDGGTINLTGGAGISLLRSVRIDSNADDINHTTKTGNAGSIYLGGPISASAPGFTLDVEAASSTGYAGSINSNGAVGAGSTGAYLSGLTFNAHGAYYDEYIYLYGGSYLLNGDFSSKGNTYFTTATTIDTEQGNVGNAGNISLSGSSVYTNSYTALNFDASTTAAGMHGGNVDLAGTDYLSYIYSTAVLVDTTGGAGGTAGSIKLPNIDTTYGQAAGTQTYRGGVISLYGALNSNGGNVLLDGDVHVAGTQGPLIIKTWTDATTQTGGAGSVTITGGVSGAAAGAVLVIDTSVATGAALYNGSADYTLSGGAVSLAAGNAGGNYLDGLYISTMASGAHNAGASSGALTLGGVHTTGAQYYFGGIATLTGNLASDGGTIDLSSLAGVTLGATPIALTSAGGAINFGSTAVNGASALSIDTTVAGANAGALTLGALGTSAALTSLQAKGGSITVNGAIASSGDVTLQSVDNGALTLNGALAAGGNIVAASAGTFVNHAGATVFSTGIGKTWQIWSADPAADTLGGLAANFKQYNAQYGLTTVLGSGNGVLYTLAPTITADLAGSAVKTYDGSAAASLANASVTAHGTADGDIVTLSQPVSASYANANAGSGKLVTVDGIAITSVTNGAQAIYGYQLASSSASAAIGTVNTRAVIVDGIAAATRVYDGTSNVTLTGGTLSGLVGNETLSLGALSGSYADKNVGSAKGVTVDAPVLVDGTGLASNYSIVTVNPVTGAVTARALTVAASGVNRVYDGSTAATVALRDNRVAGDSLTVTDTGARFADKNAAAGKTVSVTGIAVTGADAANYTFNTTAVTTADIAARALTIGASAASRVYDGSTAATVTLADNRVAGDSLLVTDSSATFADKNAASGKTVSVSGITVGGVDAANYTANTTATTSADITARALLVAATGINRVYDGSTAATVTLGDNRVAGDSLLLADGGATFADKNAASGKTVSVTGITVGGADAANYTASTTATTSADITARALLVAATAASRVYDGSTAASVTLEDNRVAGDSLMVTDSGAAFSDKNAAAGKTVSVNGIALNGVDAANYTVNTTATASADITARALLVAASGIDRVYDGSNAATVTLADNRVAGDSLLVTGSSATFADKNAASGKTVSVSGIAITGLDAANYVANTTATTSATITARALTVGATAASKLYDGAALAAVTLLDNRVAGDSLSVAAAAASFADANPGIDKTVTVSGITVSGPDAGNYTVNPTATTTGSVASNAALESAIGAVTNANVVPTAATQLAASTLPAVVIPAQSGFVTTPSMQSVLGGAFGQGTYIDAVMAPGAGPAGVPVTQSALAQLVQPGADGVLRVSLQQHGLASIVGGGVRLPDGVEQQFFIVPAQAATAQ